MKFLDNIKISKKLPVIILIGAIFSSSIIGIVSYNSAKGALVKSEEQKLIALKDARKSQLADYLESIKEDLLSIASNPFTAEALGAFDIGWYEMALSQSPEKALQNLYITNNPHPTGQKENLDYAKDGSEYSAAHKKYHPWFRSFLRKREYYDIFLFDLKGNLIYSVFKELDYATNMNTGKWKNTDLANAYRAAMATKKPGSLSFFDFKPYAPSYDAPASFISTAVYDENKRLQGVLVFQMPIGRINKIMQSSAGMGESGETYIVGKDLLMRSDSRFSEESTILKTKIDTSTAKSALEGKKGVEIITDYRGIDVVSAYISLDFLGTTWAVIAEKDESEMLQPVISMRNSILVVMGVLSIVIVFVSIFFARMITSPISTITGAMEVLSKGDTSLTVPESHREDEIGNMAKALEVFKDNRIEADRLQEEQKQEQQTQLDRAENINKITSEFELSVSDLISALSAASVQLDSTAQSMSSIAEETTSQSTAMSNASNSASQNIQTVASAAEELTSSIKELSAQVGKTSTSTSEAASDVDKTSRQIETLLESSEKIGDVVGLIQDIAEQTNLLALNATIESARAGEAGKGFAVVANEVKTLANETSKATEQIAEEVNSVQGEIRSAVDAIKNIDVKIKDVDSAASAIAAAVEEQSATTAEISKNTQTSATNMSELNGNVENVSDAAKSTGIAADDVLGASTELSKQMEHMKVTVSEFLNKVKAA